MRNTFTNAELEAYLDEALGPEDMAAVETSLRQSPELARQLVAIYQRRDSGVHSVGEIWRFHRLSCVQREQLGSYLLGVLDAETSDYIRFHLETIHCRYCMANLHDLQRKQSEVQKAAARRRRIQQSGIGLLRKS